VFWNLGQPLKCSRPHGACEWIVTTTPDFQRRKINFGYDVITCSQTLVESSKLGRGDKYALVHLRTWRNWGKQRPALHVAKLLKEGKSLLFYQPQTTKHPDFCRRPLSPARCKKPLEILLTPGKARLFILPL